MAWQTNDWVTNAGQTGGSNQVGAAWTKTFTQSNGDGTFSRCDEHFYAALQPGVGFVVSNQVEMVVCTDPADPATVTWTNTRYAYQSNDIVYGDGPSADMAALAAASAVEAPDVDLIWNGAPY